MAAADSSAFADNFTGLGPAWHVAEYDFDHPAFDTDWRREQVRIAQGLELNLAPHKAGTNRFVGASVRREVPSHFGRYEVVIQPAKGEGLVTGFFTYTGPHYGTRHDEIDIEFLGRDTTKMHVAWFVDGELTNEFIDLGFDAADRPRAYAFEWRAEGLRWFAEGRLIFEHRTEDGAIPAVPGRLYANLWAADPSIAEWSGRTSPGTRAQARVLSVRFIPDLIGPGT